MREKICFFTGHRILPSSKLDLIESLLKRHISELAANGVTTFIAGGALGFDMLAAEKVIEMKESAAADIKLWLYLPCSNHTEKWRNSDKIKLFNIKKSCDKVFYVSRCQYTRSCMLRRNEKMAEDASVCIAFMLSARSGTGYALRCAKNMGDDIINIADELYE